MKREEAPSGEPKCVHERERNGRLVYPDPKKETAIPGIVLIVRWFFGQEDQEDSRLEETGLELYCWGASSPLHRGQSPRKMPSTS